MSSSPTIAEFAIEKTEPSESFFSKHKGKIFVVVIILLIALAIWYQYGGNIIAKMQTGSTELSKKIDETINTINKKQNDKLRN
jgi:hypothetical protein